jgi:arginine N-succinyltransferase
MPVYHLLRRAGFHFLGTVDPFDGGPHYGAMLEEVQPMQRSRALVCLDFPPAEIHPPVLLGNPVSHHFHAAPAEVRQHGMRLDKITAELLALQPGDLVWHMPLDW